MKYTRKLLKKKHLLSKTTNNCFITAWLRKIPYHIEFSLFIYTAVIYTASKDASGQK